MVKELDTIVLAVNLPDYQLQAGDIGTIVLVHQNQAGYEVEFVALDGETIAIVSLFPDQLRPIRAGEIAHVRPTEINP